jgi:hypothetical protein
MLTRERLSKRSMGTSRTDKQLKVFATLFTLFSLGENPMKASTSFFVMVVLLLMAQACAPAIGPDQVSTSVAGTLTALPLPSSPETHSPAPTEALTPESAAIAPYPDAPLCQDTGESHVNSVFHTLWDSVHGCHYDHEHGQNPFTQEVAATFPGLDLRALIGRVGVGHTNPSSPMENTHKHGGFKWDVTLSHSAGCFGGTGYPTGVDAMVIQYHAFGDYSIEFESRTHSAVGLLRQCQVDNPTDFGYMFLNQLQDYGQRVSPYQGNVLPYPDAPAPAYESNRAPYFSVSCFGSTALCNKFPSPEFVVGRENNASSTWISSPGRAGSGSHLFALLFRLRDTYQMLDDSDQTYPFTFAWLCSADGGATYEAVPGCQYNNSTTRVHEVMGEIPAGWDNLAGFDTDPRAGRITAEGYVTRYGDLNPSCAAPGEDCHPIKLVQAFTGRYLSTFSLVPGEKANFSAQNLPERDIYFCQGVVCAEGDPGASSSGWIGQNN